MLEITVNIVLKDSSLSMPRYRSEFAAGVDLPAAEDGVIMAGERKLVPTGVFMEIPVGYEGQIRPRSGLALKRGIGALNSPGTIDSDYRGEVGVILFNTSSEPFYYKKGDRIAQIVFAEVARAKLRQVSELTETVRGGGGFGSTDANP